MITATRLRRSEIYQQTRISAGIAMRLQGAGVETFAQLEALSLHAFKIALPQERDRVAVLRAYELAGRTFPQRLHEQH